MGSAPSMDDEIKQMKDITVDFTEKFSKNYTKISMAKMVKLRQHEQAKEARGAKWELLKAKKPEAPARKTGVMLKLSKHLKNWNKRYFAVRGNWLLDYWETEEKYNKGEKPRGTINIGCYTVVRDPNQGMIDRIAALAKKVNLPVDQIPLPKPKPDNTIELYDDVREAIYLQCESAEDFKPWCDMLDRCRYYAPTLDIDDDKVHRAAFRPALWRTRWDCDMWGWWWASGGEVVQMSDAINQKIMWDVMGSVDAKLTMPWAARSRIRDSFQKQTSAYVDTACKAFWKPLYETVKKARDGIQDKMDEMIQPVTDAQTKVQDQIKEKVLEQGKSVIAEKVTPHLEGVLSDLFAPVVDAYRLLIKAFENCLERNKDGYKENDSNDYLIRHSWYSEYWDAERKLYDMYDTLWNARKVFDDVSPWSIIGKARRRLRKIFNNALYTFEVRLKEAGGKEAGWDKVAGETREIMLRDCRQAVSYVMARILFGVVEDFWEKLVIKPARAVVRPLADAVPDTLKDYCDPEDILEETLFNILLEACKTAFEPFTSRVELV